MDSLVSLIRGVSHQVDQCTTMERLPASAVRMDTLSQGAIHVLARMMDNGATQCPHVKVGGGIHFSCQLIIKVM